jgi:hypothetical protein
VLGDLPDLPHVVLLAAFAGVGFAVLVQASPLGSIPYKPFACRTCLSGWGGIFASGWLLEVAGTMEFATLATWALASFAATGLAHLVLGWADGSTAATPSFLPPPLP